MIWIACAVVVYMGAFVMARRPVSLRLSRIGALMMATSTVVLVAHFVPANDQNWPTVAMLAFCWAIGGGMAAFRRVWIVRMSRHQLREHVTHACRRILLNVTPDHDDEIQLHAKSRSGTIRLLYPTRITVVVVLPSRKPRDKIALLVDWLGKELPGPMPQIRIDLKRKPRSR